MKPSIFKLLENGVGKEELWGRNFLQFNSQKEIGYLIHPLTSVGILSRAYHTNDGPFHCFHFQNLVPSKATSLFLKILCQVAKICPLVNFYKWILAMPPGVSQNQSNLMDLRVYRQGLNDPTNPLKIYTQLCMGVCVNGCMFIQLYYIFKGGISSSKYLYQPGLAL